MSWAPLLLLLALSALCAGAAAQNVLTQPSSLSVAPGQTARLPCVMSSGRSIGGYGIRWYQQRPGSPPRYLLYYSSSLSRASGTPERFSASKDPSSNTCHLLITGTLGEDEADYYCQADIGGSAYLYIFGGGTQLNVLTGETRAPSLSIFPPSQEEVEKNKATVVCLLQDFYPASLDVTWKVDGQIFTNGVEKSRATKQSENNLFMASSYLSLPPMDWSAEKTVTCQVTHQGKTFEKSVKKSECV